MKHGETQNEQSTHDAREETAPNAVKAAYSRPVLTTYGSVSRLTRGVGGTQADLMNMTKMPLTGGGSDRRIKENIASVGEHFLGIGLYLFDYKPEYREQWGHGRRFGVMADEVETVMPQAVSTHPDGYKMVDYAMLGISLAMH
ncbi:MAG: tail fiber domain-containing protein [Burkholderiales bacterium]|nr:tail fiber domain-containing protein [Burkholderiales bacterium]